MAKLVSTNPARNYKKVGEVDVSTSLEIKEKVELANEVKKEWKELGVSKRTELLRPLLKDLKERKEEIALLTTREIGKPIKEARGDIDWDVDYLKEFLKDGKNYLSDEVTYKGDGEVHRLVFEPIGSAAVIVPWNFPFANFLWGVIPNLIAGNTVVFKHSEECPLVGRLCEKMIEELNLPEGVFNEVYGGGAVGEMLARQDVDLIWFTGSSAVGKRLYQIAGEKQIKAVLEMGGSNPAVIFDDVSIDSLVDRLYEGRFLNNGQVCDAIKRIIVQKSVAQQLVEKLKKKVSLAVVGDPEEEKTDIGSLVAKRQLELLKAQVADAAAKGAKIEIGGEESAGMAGAYYLPTIVTHVDRSMKIWNEEVFGPVLPVVEFSTEDEAVELANDTIYGLGAMVFSKDKKRAKRVASQIDAGCIDINDGNHWKACNPFGGYKASGMGREHGRVGFRELCQIKVIAEG